MKRGMRPMGAGGLIWLIASGCGETTGDSDPETSSGSDSAMNDSGSMGTATTGSAMGAGTPSASNASNGTVGTSTTGASGVGGGMGTGTGTGTGGTSCPNIEPAPGASCVDEGVSCEFENCVAPDFRNGHTLICQDGAWVLTNDVECLADCPETPPVIGDTCDATATPGPCPVTNACGTSYAYCSSGEWSLQPSGRAPVPNPGPSGAGGSSSDIIALICPNPAPALGSDCCPSQYPTYCDYTSGQGVPGAGGGSGFVPPSGTTGSQGGAEAASTTDTSGATGSEDGAGASGPTGGTGANPALCMLCDPTSMQWLASDACY